jgi:hypothetical protein
MPSCREPDSPDEAASMIIEVFQRITDINLRAPHPEGGIEVPLFRKEGMSGGFVSPQWWNDELLPLMKHRIEKQFGGQQEQFEV